MATPSSDGTCNINVVMATADLIVEARRRAGLSQRELAARSGHEQATIARWESGHNTPTLEVARQVLAACGLELAVHLANHDDSYYPLIADQLRLAPSQRVAALLAGSAFDPAPIARALERHRVPYLLIGALADVLQGSPVAPGDQRYTIVIADEAAARAALQRVLEDLDAQTAPRDDSLPGIPGVEVWRIPAAGGELALDLYPPGAHGYRDLARDADRLALLPALSVPVASLRDLARIAEASPSPRDQARVPALRATRELTRDPAATNARLRHAHGRAA